VSVRCPVLVGRDAELAVFTDALSCLRRGESQLCSWSGKQALALEDDLGQSCSPKFLTW
jgi:hypothetical protein